MGFRSEIIFAFERLAQRLYRGQRIMTQVLMRSQHAIVLSASLVFFARHAWTQEINVIQCQSVETHSSKANDTNAAMNPHLMGYMATHDTNWADLMKNMETMHAAMTAVKPSGNEDVDFVNLMLPHHQAAVDMARTELLYGRDPQMRRLAQEIIADQKSEIQLMQLWLDRQRVHTKDLSHLPGSGSRKEK
ncbi:MAG TPA: DUF305 domain-containing protein [Terriglobales bacterium]|nr:DUF305 domain-containing protein [Terriglobales bacterium]